MTVKLAAVLIAATAGFAMGAPKVVTDIPPVHSLVAGVMGDTGAPELILRPGASPHGYAMAPSEARAVAGADIVFWIGPALTPWLDRAIETLSPNAQAVALLDADGVRTLPFREGALFETHDHGHEEHGDHDDHGDDHGDDHAAHDDKDEHHDEHAHDEGHHEGHTGVDEAKVDEHAEHGHDDHDGEGHEEVGHGEAGHGEAGHDDHAHEAGERDPHIWLDPRNARALTRAIVSALSDADPANAAAYAANGAAQEARLAALEVEIADTVAGAKGRPFIVFHDAYHYFEARFDIEASGAISVSDADAPGPARLQEIQTAIQSFATPCIFTEPQFPETRARLVMEGSDAKLAVLDPMGAALDRGPTLYDALLRNMAGSMAACLAD